MEKLMNYIERNYKAIILSLSIMVGILLLMVISLFFCSVKLRTDLNDTLSIIQKQVTLEEKIVNQIEYIHNEMDEFTGMSQDRRIQQIRLKIAADSALASYIMADKRGLESMIKLMETPKKE